MFLDTIIHKIFETNSNFHVTAQYGKSLISVFREHFASINKIFILAGGLASALPCYGVETLSSYFLIS